MKRSVRYIFLLVVAMMLATPALRADSAAPVWEYISQRDDSAADTPRQGEGRVETEVVDGKLYIYLEEPAKVQIFSILGQLITERHLKAGTTRLTLRQRGVYILKAGSITRRINL